MSSATGMKAWEDEAADDGFLRIVIKKCAVPLADRKNVCTFAADFAKPAKNVAELAQPVERRIRNA